MLRRVWTVSFEKSGVLQYRCEVTSCLIHPLSFVVHDCLLANVNGSVRAVYKSRLTAKAMSSSRSFKTITFSRNILLVGRPFRLGRGILQWVKSVDHTRLMLSAGCVIEIITSRVVGDFTKSSSTSCSTQALGAQTVRGADGIIVAAGSIEVAVHAQVCLVG